MRTLKEEELHYLIHYKLQKLPQFHAVYVLYGSRGAVEVGAGTLRNVVPVAAAKYPEATCFSIHGSNLTRLQDTEQLADKLRPEFRIGSATQEGSNWIPRIESALLL